MEAQHLYMAADKKVSLRKSGSLREIEATVKKTYGVDNPGTKQTLLSDQLFNLITKAEADSKTFFISNSAGKDPVHEFLGHNTGSKVESKSIHPMDEAFNMISQALEVANNEARVIKERNGRIANLDPVNEIVKQTHADSDPDKNAVHTVADVYKSIENIYKCRVSSGTSAREIDPAQQIIINAMGDGRFPSDPVHTLAEWNSLLELATGKNVNSVIDADSIDIVDELAARSAGLESPAAKQLSIVQSDLIQATYLMAYKLSPGTEAYNKKEKEVISLKSKRDKLQNIIKEASE